MNVRSIFERLTLFCVLLIPQLVNAQLSPFIGTWITSENESITIRDTMNEEGGSATLYNGGEDKDFDFIRYADTLSFQFQYYSSATDYKILYNDRYDFRIISFNDSTLTIVPVSDLSKKFFGKTSIKFTNQAYAADTSIHLEKIIYHTTSCYGSCPVYHLEIGVDRTMKLHREKSTSIFPEDEEKIGYFRDTLALPDYQKLIANVRSINLKTLDPNGALCCDGSIVTLIVYYNNGQRKYFKSMFPPPVLYSLLEQLHEICEGFDFSNTSVPFEIEEQK